MTLLERLHKARKWGSGLCLDVSERDEVINLVEAAQETIDQQDRSNGLYGIPEEESLRAALQPFATPQEQT